MQITVNGESREFEDGASLGDVVARLNIDAGKVAVERNLEVVPRSTYGEVRLADGDAIEIVRFIGGG